MLMWWLVFLFHLRPLGTLHKFAFIFKLSVVKPWQFLLPTLSPLLPSLSPSFLLPLPPPTPYVFS